MRLKPPTEGEEVPGQFWKDFVRETAPEFRKPTIDQLEGFILPVWQELVDGARYVDERLTEIFDELKPDAIVEDNVVAFPAVPASGIPWVRIVSCNPLELKDAALPPTFSGYPSGEPAGWEGFRARYRELHDPLQPEFSEFCVERGAPPLPEGEFIHESPFLNLYVYPAEADYERPGPLAGWARLDSCVRETDTEFELPRDERRRIYLSLGSLGSADVELMQRLIDALAETDHLVVVSMGPRHDELRLGENMIGAEFLPQPAILPQVDLVITHGGNNTTIEAFHFGKPMVVLPLFWDQYDNAQRVDETGFGVRLPTYAFEPDDLTGAIDGLLGNVELRTRMAGIGAEIRARDGVAKAAAAIESVGLAAR
jgi:MGT family glycosyltransferase